MPATEVAMPNKTIYVSDDDLPLYQRAQQLAGGNLSSAIAQALRRFVDTMTAHEQGLEEITVWVGAGSAARRNRFRGRLLGRWVHTTGERDEVFTVYGTAKGQFALHVQRGGWPAAPEWPGRRGYPPQPHRPPTPPGMQVPPAPPAPPAPPPPPAPPGGFGHLAPPAFPPMFGTHLHWGAPGTSDWGPPPGEATLDVFDSIDAMRDRIPPELAEMLERPSTPEIEDLDI